MGKKKRLLVSTPEIEKALQYLIKQGRKPTSGARLSRFKFKKQSLRQPLVNSVSTQLFQFAISNLSNAHLQIAVIDGNTPDSDIAGTLNGVQYQKAEFTVPDDGATYYIYAIDGTIYLLNHTFSSDLFPVLLIGSVSVIDGALDIVQINTENDPIVPVCGEQYGAITLKGTLNYADYALTASYTVSVKGMLNNLPFEFVDVQIPESESGRLWAYVESVTVDNNTSPVSGFVFAENPGKQWQAQMLNYSLTSTDFKVKYRQELLHFFTFTQIHLNAEEAGA